MTQQAPFPTHETTPRTSIRWWRTLAAGILLLSGVIAAHAQVAPNGQKQMGAQLPEIMRWIWRDYPRSADPDNKEERSFHGPAGQ